MIYSFFLWRIVLIQIILNLKRAAYMLVFVFISTSINKTTIVF